MGWKPHEPRKDLLPVHTHCLCVQGLQLRAEEAERTLGRWEETICRGRGPTLAQLRALEDMLVRTRNALAEETRLRERLQELLARAWQKRAPPAQESQAAA